MRMAQEKFEEVLYHLNLCLCEKSRVRFNISKAEIY